MTRRRSRNRGGIPIFLAVGAGAVLAWWCRRSPSPPAPAEPPRVEQRTPAAPTAVIRPEATARKRDRAKTPADFEPAGERHGLLAVVLDDMGYDPSAITRLASFQLPLALSVIPTSPHVREASALARDKGWDLMVHLPMSPEIGAGEQGAIGPQDDDRAITVRVNEALDRVPGALGVNNHQGSRASADARVARAVLAAVKPRGLFFLDSRTSAATVLESEARAMGVPALSRDVFLDDAATEAASPGGAAEALDAAWKKALDTVARKGACVVIGHPHRATLDFLAARLPALKAAGITAVRVSELVD